MHTSDGKIPSSKGPRQRRAETFLGDSSIGHCGRKKQNSELIGEKDDKYGTNGIWRP
jgi:hypothetical protein